MIRLPGLMAIFSIRRAAQPALRRGADTGFSLVELLVVIAIMSVLASIGLPLAELSRQRVKEEELRRSLREIRNAIDAYKRLVDLGSIQRAADGSGYPPGLDVLAQGVVDARSPQGSKLYLMRKLPRDPFAPLEVATPVDTWSPRSYASPPDDPKPGKDVFDVHSKSAAVGLNGIAYRDW
jgi:general secretion pathway protein G